jgi:hypothetical protein
MARNLFSAASVQTAQTDGASPATKREEPFIIAAASLYTWFSPRPKPWVINPFKTALQQLVNAASVEPVGVAIRGTLSKNIDNDLNSTWSTRSLLYLRYPMGSHKVNIRRRRQCSLPTLLRCSQRAGS